MQVLADVQKQTHTRLTEKLFPQNPGDDVQPEGWRSLDEEALCATINDYFRMQAKCQAFADTAIPLIQQEEQQEVLADKLTELGDSYVHAAIDCTHLLAR